jgi:DNA invertase Pin-like site-specific DNA recombinase
MHILGAIAEFERARIQERVRAGLNRARAHGVRLGRPPKVLSEERLTSVRGLPVRQAAQRLGVSASTAHRWLSR